VFGVRKSLIAAPVVEDGQSVVSLVFTLAPESA
jgi:hypothetical protein